MTSFGQRGYQPGLYPDSAHAWAPSSWHVRCAERDPSSLVTGAASPPESSPANTIGYVRDWVSRQGAVWRLITLPESEGGEAVHDAASLDADGHHAGE